MPVALIIAIVQAMAALAPQLPEVITLAESATRILNAGTVSAEDEAAIRAQLDAVRALIDAA
jgi:hypothetical protein